MDGAPITPGVPQRQLSAAISHSVPEFPGSVADLIAEMAGGTSDSIDYSLATQALCLDNLGRVIACNQNTRILEVIRLAIVAPSTECDPKIKAQIIDNAADPDGKIRRYLYLDVLRHIDQPVNLDGVHLQGLALDLDVLDLTGMSAIGATFENIVIQGTIMNHADFTGATFIKVNLTGVWMSGAVMSNATLIDVTFNYAKVNGMIINQSALLQRAIVVQSEIRLGASFSELWLLGLVVTGRPDCASIKFPPPWRCAGIGHQSGEKRDRKA